MRIGLIVYGDLQRTSGGYLYDRKLVEYLRDRGDDVRVFSQPDRSYPRRLLDNFDLGFARRVTRSNVDVLLQDELNHASLCVMNWWLRRRIDAPITTIVHHLRSSENRPSVERECTRWLERLYLASTDARIYNSTVTRRAVESLAGSTPSVVARPSGRRFGDRVSDRTIIDRAHRSGPLRLVFVGNVTPRKRLHVLLTGLARVERVDWTLDVVGDVTTAAPYVRRIRRAIQAYDVGHRVTLHGRLADDSLDRMLRASHALAVPSDYEGYGIVYVEAMGRGLPVLAGGVRDIVEDGVTGHFVCSAEDIAVAVRRWGGDRTLLATMGQAAAAYYRSTPTWEATAHRVARFLDSLAAMKAPAAS